LGVALLIYALAEDNESLPDQKGKPTKTPTIRWVFQVFEGIDVLSVWQNEKLVTRQLLNLRPTHRQVLKLVGKSVQNCYLIDS
jgi:hypothetical protein